VLEVRLSRLFISWKPWSWAVDSTEVLFTIPICPACALTFRTAFSSIIVAVYMPYRALKVASHLRLRKSLLPTVPLCCVCIHCHGKVFNESFSRNGHLWLLHFAFKCHMRIYVIYSVRNFKYINSCNYGWLLYYMTVINYNYRKEFPY
jgi:hypothetical protein